MNEETKDTRMLPVQCNCAWNPDRHADSCPVNLRDRLADAQARLAEKNARIAQLAAHARGKNKALANALKEIERLKKGIDYLRDNLEAAYEDRKELRAQLEQLQAAPAERGAVVLPERKDPDTYSRGSPDWHAAHAQNECLDEVASLNPAPATADSDVREVKE